MSRGYVTRRTIFIMCILVRTFLSAAAAHSAIKGPDEGIFRLQVIPLNDPSSRSLGYVVHSPYDRKQLVVGIGYAAAGEVIRFTLSGFNPVVQLFLTDTSEQVNVAPSNRLLVADSVKSDFPNIFWTYHEESSGTTVRKSQMLLRYVDIADHGIGIFVCFRFGHKYASLHAYEYAHWIPQECQPVRLVLPPPPK